VRGRSAREILDAFRRRLDNEPDEEFSTALKQVHRIARLRLEALGL
jgi:2-oxo-4-hydroxy-4-carboxy--5-ureidoimidazoline (OHCU) decarboxylase